MSQHIELIGAEQVSRASNHMQSAADQMQRAASSIAHALEMHQRHMDDWLARLQSLLEQQAKPTGGY